MQVQTARQSHQLPAHKITAPSPRFGRIEHLFAAQETKTCTLGNVCFNARSQNKKLDEPMQLGQHQQELDVAQQDLVKLWAAASQGSRYDR